MTQIKNLKKGDTCKLSPYGVVWVIEKEVKNEYGLYKQIISARGASKWLNGKHKVQLWTRKQ